jgi:hypothetical protein
MALQGSAQWGILAQRRVVAKLVVILGIVMDPPPLLIAASCDTWQRDWLKDRIWRNADVEPA